MDDERIRLPLDALAAPMRREIAPIAMGMERGGAEPAGAKFGNERERHRLIEREARGRAQMAERRQIARSGARPPMAPDGRAGGGFERGDTIACAEGEIVHRFAI